MKPWLVYVFHEGYDDPDLFLTKAETAVAAQDKVRKLEPNGAWYRAISTTDCELDAIYLGVIQEPSE